MELGLVMLVRLAWIAGTLPILVASISWFKLNWFRDLILGFSKRGKTLQSSSSEFTVPQKFFGHFYALAVFWTTILLVATWLYACNVAPLTPEFSSISNTMELEKTYGIWLAVFLLLLMEAQVIRRLYETIYVFKYSASARMHILGYIIGLYFYTAAPLSLCCPYVAEVFQFVSNLSQESKVQGKDQMQFVETSGWPFAYPFLKLKWYAWLGAIIFLFGWIHQHRCHAILGLVREKSDGNDDYVIPYGDWFRYVSCPHYLAEIVIYAGLLVASGCSDVTVWFLFVFVVANLVFAAAETQRWYLRKFDNYPRDRFAIIPYIY